MTTLSFLLFEACCGVYFPCIGTLRSKYIPEKTRAAIMNFFRVPLNFLVVFLLYGVGELENSTVFFICAVWITIALALMIILSRKAGPVSKDVIWPSH